MPDVQVDAGMMSCVPFQNPQPQGGFGVGGRLVDGKPLHDKPVAISEAYRKGQDPVCKA
jgi:hypothetical protein